jgi:hypothetical protein
MKPTLPSYSNAFDCDETAALAAAFDQACRSMHDWGQPDIIREIIAKRIIEVAGNGERDPDRLCYRALRALGFNERVLPPA